MDTGTHMLRRHHKKVRLLTPHELRQAELSVGISVDEPNAYERYQALLAEQPDISVPQAARELGMSPNYLYRLKIRAREQNA